MTIKAQTDSDQSDTLAGWGTKRTQKRACPVCGAPNEVGVQVRSYLSGKGQSSLTSSSMSLCNGHALVLYRKLEALMEEYS